MKKNTKIFLFFVSILIFVLLSFSIIYLLNQSKISASKMSMTTNLIDGQPDMINIEDCSEEFMNEYFEKSQEIQEKDNVLIVTSKDGIVDSYGAKEIIEAPNYKYILQYDTMQEKMNAFEELSNSTEYIVEENIVHTISEYEAFDVDENATYNSWGIKSMSLHDALVATNGKELNEITVAIIDTGCDMTLFNKSYPGKIVETYNVYDDNEMYDSNGHGTHIAGTIAEGTPDNVKILPIKVSDDGNIYLSDILEAINYVVYYDKADVINMSFGSYSRSSSEYDAIASANEKNIICIAAAGNKNTTTKNYPAGYDNTMSIASVDSSLNKSSFSNYGSSITFAAPGSYIISINGTKSGTSMATPHAVCAVALLKSYNDTITLEDSINLLSEYAVDLGDEGYDVYYGNGFISFGGAEFCERNNCDGSGCDEFCIFKSVYKEPVIVESIEVPLAQITSYNYGSIYNILATKLQINYNDESNITKALWEFDDLQIEGYDPYSTEEQIIKLTYEGVSTTFTIIHPEEYVLGWEYEILDDNTIQLTNYISNAQGIRKLYLPETIEGHIVSSVLGEEDTISVSSVGVFDSNTDSFDTLILPENLKKLGSAPSNVKEVISYADSIEVGSYAFYGNTNLKSINTIISKVGEESFYNCTSLDNIVLADTIEEIPLRAFGGCLELENINIPTNLKTLGIGAFFNTHIKDVVIPEGVTVIEQETFAGCYNLENLTLPETLTTIKEYAFNNTGIIELYIPKNVTYIDSTSFRSSVSLEYIYVDENNTVYDSRNDCSALIETESNKLILGSAITEIPPTVQVIGEFAFYGNYIITGSSIPEGVVEIQQYAFYNCPSLSTILVPRSAVIFGTKAFGSSILLKEGNLVYKRTLWLYNDSAAKTYAVDNELIYETFDPSYMLVYRNKSEYKAFETVAAEDITKIDLYHERADIVNDTYKQYKNYNGRKEETTNYTIQYMNSTNSFRYGDTYYVVTGINQFEESMDKQVSVTVLQQTPIYTVPEGLTTDGGEKLEDIVLPEGFEWMDGTQVTIGKWDEVYYAKYIPEDSVNYETIENIEIILNKKYKDITNVIVDLSKTEYTAFETINPQDVTITLEYTDNSTEQITTNFEIIYNNNNDSFRYGDTSFTIKGYSKMKELVEKQVEVTVYKAIPEYTIPIDLKALLNQTLEEIELPSGFEWVDKTQKLTEAGEIKAYITYTPEDTINYETIKNIEILVTVIDIKCEEIYSPSEEFILEEDTFIANLGIYALPENAIKRDLTFEIEDTNIAKIEDDKIILVKDGTTNLIVKTTDDSNITKIIPITIDLPLPFIDISKDAWCYSAVKFVYKNGYILGTSPTTYEPATKLSRGMIVTILWRIEGKQRVEGESIFPDVKEDQYFYEAVKWAYENKIISGYDDGTFAPNKSVTREELVVILRNYTKKYRGIDTDSIKGDLTQFNDYTKISSYAVSAMEWAIGTEVITGFADDNTIRCYSTATRDVAASIIYKYFKNIN